MPHFLRAATEDDAPFLRQVYAGTREAELANTGWDEAHKTAFVQSQFELQQRHHRQHFPGAHAFVVWRHDEPGSSRPVGQLRWQWQDDALRLIDIDIDIAALYLGLGFVALAGGEPPGLYQPMRWQAAPAVRDATEKSPRSR